jgi:Protein tyrosine and serine/threonine kinase
VIRHEPYGEAADVFSYAVVLWQLLTREEPFAGKGQVEAAAAVALDGKRMGFPPSTPPPVIELISQCWDAMPGHRPSFEAIVDSLTPMIDSLSLDDKLWLDAARGHPMVPAIADHHDDRAEPKPPTLANLHQKRKGLRSLFNRKSVYF